MIPPDQFPIRLPTDKKDYVIKTPQGEDSEIEGEDLPTPNLKPGIANFQKTLEEIHDPINPRRLSRGDKIRTCDFLVPNQAL